MNEGQALGVDAPVASFGITARATEGRPNGGGRAKRGSGGGGRQQQQPPVQQHERKQPKPKKVTNVADGKWTTNRRGRTLCQGFQTGACSNPNCWDAHQCALCLSPDHGTANCQNNTSSKHKSGGGGGGAGGRGGKGKGKGKKNRYPY